MNLFTIKIYAPAARAIFAYSPCLYSKEYKKTPSGTTRKGKLLPTPKQKVFNKAIVSPSFNKRVLILKKKYHFYIKLKK